MFFKQIKLDWEINYILIILWVVSNSSLYLILSSMPIIPKPSVVEIALSSLLLSAWFTCMAKDMIGLIIKWKFHYNLKRSK